MSTWGREQSKRAGRRRLLDGRERVGAGTGWGLGRGRRGREEKRGKGGKVAGRRLEYGELGTSPLEPAAGEKRAEAGCGLRESEREETRGGVGAVAERS